jgi:predicted N-acetyltransferase YhbS
LPTHPRDLGVRLAARGFEWGWQPHWMGLALRKLPADLSLPEGLRIAVEDECDWEVEDLPYYSRENAAVLHALARARPRRIWRFGAWRGGKIVGHCALLLTTGRMGVAGLYDVGVIPSARKQGIGRAVTLAACQFAQALGCHHALLNSAASEFYAKLGFESLGWGQTWWMHAPTLTATPPTSEQVACLEAVGRGDLRALSAFEGQTLPLDLDVPLPCGTTPIGLAAQSRQPASAQWLAAQGATLEIGHAWELGWKDRIPRMLADSPELANRHSGPWQITPLHAAVERGDIELVRLLLTAHPDPDIQDTQFHSAPLGWAHHFGRTEIIALLEEYQAARKERS